MREFILVALLGLSGFLFSSSSAQAQSQAQMNSESKEIFEKLDALLNKSYKDLLARNDEDPSFAGVLKEAQRAWLKYVELHMTSVFPLVEGENPQDVYGTSYPLEYNTEKTKLYRQRIDLLNAMTGEGDMPDEFLPTQAPSNEKQAAATTPLTPAGPKGSGLPPQIKGLGIGMGFSDLVPWFDEKLKTTNLGYEIFSGSETNVFMIAEAGRLRYLQKNDGGKKFSASDREYQLKSLSNGFSENTSFMLADAKGEVYSILLQPPLVNYLFKSKDIDFSEFINLFVEAYELKESAIIDNIQGSFSCTTKNGIKFTIKSDKTLIIKEVEEPAKVKGAFD